jgi:branched-chain amino acid transport system permease protein
MSRRIKAGAAFVLIAAALSATPVLGNDYQIRFALHMALFIGLAYSWNIISGYTGYLSFGHVAFVGIGQYCAAVLVVKLGAPWPVALIAAGTLAGLVAIPFGWVLLRLRGLHFAVGTLAIGQLLLSLSNIARPLTNGSTGLYLPPERDLTLLYWVAIGVVLALIGLTFVIENSRFGLRLLAIREDEIGARSLGIHTTREKVFAYMLSAIGPGVIGALWAWDLRFVSPLSAFNVTWEVTFLTMAVFGGAGLLWGPLVGGISLGVVAELLWANFPFIHIGINGLAIVLMVLFLPGGTVAELERRGVLRPTRLLATRLGRQIAHLRTAPPVPRAPAVDDE